MPLTTGEVRDLLRRLQPELTPTDYGRLVALADGLGPDGRIAVAHALDLAAPPGDDDAKRQDSFRKLRGRLAAQAKAAGVELRIAMSASKVTPQRRRCWFVGTTVLDGSIEALAQAQARGTAREQGGQPEHYVPPNALPVAGDRPVRVYVSSVTRTTAERGRVERFIAELDEHLSSGPRSFDVVDSQAAPLGLDVEPWRDEMIARADVIVALLSPHFLARGGRERDRVRQAAEARGASGATAPERVVVALAKTDLGRHADWINHYEVLNRETPLDHASTAAQRHTCVTTVADGIRRVADRLARRGIDFDDPAPSQPGPSSPAEWSDEQPAPALALPCDKASNGVDPDDTLQRHATRQAVHGLRYVVSPDGQLISLGDVDRHDTARLRRDTESAVKAVDYLADWASSPTTRRYCALLGDLGMGKTIATKLLTRRLLEQRATDPRVPLPLLFDLRDLRPADVLADLTLRGILTLLLRQADPLLPQLSVEAVLTRIRAGGCVVIFDGLDEMLVHLNQSDQQTFTRQLWRATLDSGGPEQPPSKLLLSCRTHFFKTIADETAHFDGQDRDGPRPAAYEALLMLPFRDAQIREYLRVNLDATPERVEAIIELFESIHNLRELAQRPLTLGMLTEQVASIERAKLAGRTMRAVDIYDNLVQRWLTRESGKHSLLPEHKLLLMEQLASQLWRDGESTWEAAAVERWMLRFMTSQPDLLLDYGTDRPTPEQWKSDLRTASFIARRGDDRFGFAHRSLWEFFLARHLLRGLLGGYAAAAAAWALPLPSRETLDFLDQLVAGLTAGERHRAGQTLQGIVTEAGGSATVVAAGLIARAGSAAALATLDDADLQGADLRGWSFGRREPAAPTGVSMRRARLAGATLDGARFDGVDLTAAVLDRVSAVNTEFLGCTLADASVAGSRLAGTLFRRCRLGLLATDTALAHRATVVDSAPRRPSGRGWRVVPDEHWLGALRGALQPVTGHTGWVNAVAVTATATGDPHTIITGSHDRTARVWDATTGALRHTLTGHTDWVNAVAVTATATGDPHTIITGSNDGTARVWDATTGALRHTLTGHTGPVSAVAVTATATGDPITLITGSYDRTARVWDATTGALRHTLTGHTGPVNAVAVTATATGDPITLITGSYDRTARVWDATTGNQIGWWVELLPAGEVARWDAATGELTGASDGAWRHLGYPAMIDGAIDRLPAETFGSLPPL